MSNYVGREILLVMQDNATAKSIQSAFMNLGFWVSVSADLKSILDLLDNKFFVGAILELDTPKPGYGLKLAQKILEVSPLTATWVVSPRPDFAALLSVHRMGLRDFVQLEGEFLPYLVGGVRKAAEDIEHAGERDRLLKDMVNLHGKFLKQMIALHIKLMESEESMRYRDGVPDEELPPCKVLIVDPDPSLTDALNARVSETGGWQLIHLFGGGEALDYGTEGAFHIALICRSLPDLPGTMVFQTLKSDESDSTVFLYDHDQTQPGGLLLFENSVSQELPLQVQNPDELVLRLRDLRRHLDSSAKKKEHIKTFKAQHYDFLQEYQRVQNKVKKVMHLDDKPEP